MSDSEIVTFNDRVPGGALAYDAGAKLYKRAGEDFWREAGCCAVNCFERRYVGRGGAGGQDTCTVDRCERRAKCF